MRWSTAVAWRSRGSGSARPRSISSVPTDTSPTAARGPTWAASGSTSIGGSRHDDTHRATMALNRADSGELLVGQAHHGDERCPTRQFVGWGMPDPAAVVVLTAPA